MSWFCPRCLGSCNVAVGTLRPRCWLEIPASLATKLEDILRLVLASSNEKDTIKQVLLWISSFRSSLTPSLSNSSTAWPFRCSHSPCLPVAWLTGLTHLELLTQPGVVVAAGTGSFPPSRNVASRPVSLDCQDGSSGEDHWCHPPLSPVSKLKLAPPSLRLSSWEVWYGTWSQLWAGYLSICYELSSVRISFSHPLLWTGMKRTGCHCDRSFLSLRDELLFQRRWHRLLLFLRWYGPWLTL